FLGFGPSRPSSSAVDQLPPLYPFGSGAHRDLHRFPARRSSDLLLQIPRPQLYAGILVFAVMGIWGVSGSVFELGLMAALGMVGYVMRAYGFPIPPLLIGLILVPMAETQLRTALAAGQGRLSVLVETPISITFLLLAFLFLFVPVLLKRLRGVA